MQITQHIKYFIDIEKAAQNVETNRENEYRTERRKTR